MIRINLLPSKRKAAKASRRSSKVSVGGTASAGQFILLGMIAGWFALGAVGYWLILREEEAANALRAETTTVNARVKEIRELIDEEKLQALKDRVEQLRTAIEKLTAQQKTPAPVMNELANILTTGKMPDIDEEEQRRRENEDPKAKLNQSWDANSVWINDLVEDKGGALEIAGGARDPSDLSEFVKRLRASRRFGRVSHPEYTEADSKKSKLPEAGFSSITFKLTVQVRYWD
jgi:Tfp pilus assembly protein PilN